MGHQLPLHNIFVKQPWDIQCTSNPSSVSVSLSHTHTQAATDTENVSLVWDKNGLQEVYQALELQHIIPFLALKLLPHGDYQNTYSYNT